MTMRRATKADAEAIARIYNQVKDRPRYIIQGTVGLNDKNP